MRRFLQSIVCAGEIHELKEELKNVEKSKKKEAIKKVIAFMTVGKDVSMLFPDVVNCMQTEDLELKKLVYLYLINYAKSQPDLCILAVNTFVKVKSTHEGNARPGGVAGIIRRQV
jgi:AP-1 complex subunit beta-1